MTNKKQISTMIDIVSRLEKTQVFWDLNGFYQRQFDQAKNSLIHNSRGAYNPYYLVKK